MATRDPGLRITALDRPRVLEVTRKYAAAANVLDRLTCLNGDMHKVRLPKAAFDLVVLANVLHLEPGESIVALLRRLRPALRPCGEVVIVDIIPKRSAAMDEGQHLVSLHLGLRTPRGRIHGGDEYAEWLRAAGFRCRDQYPLRTGRSELALLLATTD